jgi:diguanylate cyclase (GGDEF)-like protein/PAS domain S-box-containing protein
MTSPPATILIVDDEVQNRKLLETLLRPEGYLTISVASGEEALASVAERAPDLILLDIMMPGMDGFQVAGTLKANPGTSHIPIIMVTASVGRDARLAGLNAGAEDFLNKPVDRGELWLRVRNLLRLKTLADFQKNHSVILEQQVKERTADLLRFRAAMEISGDSIVLVDRTTLRYIDVNQTLCTLVGRTRQELIGTTPMDLFSADRETLERDYDAIIADQNSSPSLVEGQYRHKNGSLIPIETRRRALRTDAGWIIVCTASDITQRKAAELKILRLNRVYAVLSGINTAIVRIRDRGELFRETCRLAMAEGGFALARVVELDPGGVARIAATSDPETQLIQQIVDEYNADPTECQNLLALGLRHGLPLVSNDVARDARMPNREALTAEGNFALALLPISFGKRVSGAIILRTPEMGMFDEEEMRLLRELAGDIGYALDNMEKQERLDYLAYYDSLTGLANRRLFLERVAQYMRSAAGGGHKLAVFLMDLERFKNINDSLGQSAGDELLRQVAQWLTLNAGGASLVARVGADHFALVLPEMRDDGGVARLLEKALATFLEHPFRLDDAVFRIAAKVGVAVFPENGANADSLLKNAEAALKKAKTSGDRYLFYTQKMTETVAGKLTLENQLRRALDREEFVLHYQAKVNLESGLLTGVEALIRWNDPRTGLVPPGSFIPILEETGLINEVGRWALRKSIEDYLRWRKAGLAVVRIAVNVSPLQLRSRSFTAEIARKVGVDEHAADGLELEITESLIMEDVKHSIATLQAVRAMGVTVAIDDFGTGFSSLSHLARLPVDTLKIDRSFVIDMTTGPEGLALVSTIISLAHSLKLKVVAEGVETEEQSRLLRLLGCDEMQGFLFSRPVAGDVFEAKFLKPGPAPIYNPQATMPKAARLRFGS